jgi:uncharacterized membrane protein/predicted DsbA family dithiol-disulfide isomerase
MWNRARTLLTRLAALIALGTSAALLTNQFLPNPSFCGYHSGCERVQSALGPVPGVALSSAGIVAFSGILAFSLFATRRAALLEASLCVGVGVTGLCLLLVQLLVLGQVCPYCVVVDLAGIVVACCCLLPARLTSAAEPTLERGLWWAAAGAVLLVGASLSPLMSWASQETDSGTPPEVRSFWVAGKVNIVEAVDFQCPECRKVHETVTRLCQEKGERIHLAQIAVALPSHPHSRLPARLFACACAQEKGKEMAQLLFAAPQLSPDACDRLAASIGLPAEAMHSCANARAAERQLDATIAWVRRASPQGVPVVWVGDKKLFGVQSLAALQEAVAQAERQLGPLARE